MILPDVNVLIDAFWQGSSRHTSCHRWLRRALAQPEEIGLYDVVLGGFMRTMTNPRLTRPAASVADAWNSMASLRAASNAQWLSSGPETWAKPQEFKDTGLAISGNDFTDALIAGTALAHGARAATADRGFSRYPVRWFDPGKA